MHRRGCGSMPQYRPIQGRAAGAEPTARAPLAGSPSSAPAPRLATAPPSSAPPAPCPASRTSHALACLWLHQLTCRCHTRQHRKNRQKRGFWPSTRLLNYGILVLFERHRAPRKRVARGGETPRGPGRHPESRGYPREHRSIPAPGPSRPLPLDAPHWRSRVPTPPRHQPTPRPQGMDLAAALDGPAPAPFTRLRLAAVRPVAPARTARKTVRPANISALRSSASSPRAGNRGNAGNPSRTGCRSLTT